MSELQEVSDLFSSLVMNSFAGSIGGASQVILGQPFDIVKVRMQNQTKTSPLYTSSLHCSKSILLNEGPTAFYKGTIAPLVGVAFCTSLQFGLNETTKRYFRGFNMK